MDVAGEAKVAARVGNHQGSRMKMFLLAAVPVIGAVSVLLAWHSAARRRRSDCREAITVWESAAASGRADALEPLRAADRPNAAAWYLTGVSWLREGRIRQAARCFGIAHHLDERIETAALLTFSCLKAREGSDSDLVEQIFKTWDEMKRPDLLRFDEDRLLIDSVCRTAPPAPPLSAVGRLAWGVVPSHLHSRVEPLLGSVRAKAEGPASAPRGAEDMSLIES